MAISDTLPTDIATDIVRAIAPLVPGIDAGVVTGIIQKRVTAALTGAVASVRNDSAEIAGAAQVAIQAAILDAESRFAEREAGTVAREQAYWQGIVNEKVVEIGALEDVVLDLTTQLSDAQTALETAIEDAAAAAAAAAEAAEEDKALALDALQLEFYEAIRDMVFDSTDPEEIRLQILTILEADEE